MSDSYGEGKLEGGASKLPLAPQGAITADPKDDVKAFAVEQSRALKAASDQPNDMVPYFSLFRYADSTDIILMVLGTAAGVLNGAMLPMFAIIFGSLLNGFGGATQSGMMESLVATVNKNCLYFVYLAIGAMLASYGEITCWMWTGARQANRIRTMYLRAVLRQDVAYFDRDATTGKLLMSLNEETLALQNAISEKVGTFVHNLFTFVIGIAIAFWKGWQLTLVIVAMVPVLAVIGASVAVLSSRLSRSASEAYALANTISQQALGNVRTVAAFNGEERVVRNYSAALEWPLKAGIQQGLMQGITLGAVNGVWFLSYAAAMFFGAVEVAHGNSTGGQVMNVIFAGIIGGFALGQAAPALQYFRQGRAAGASLFHTINLKPTINLDAPGKELAAVEGQLELRGVTFAYPARDDKPVLTAFDLAIPAGATVALVGESGSGKSTVIQLIQRFYDPDAGVITLDGHDIRSLQLRWLRSCMGLVSQEPTLFATSIMENIKYGRPGATDEEVYAAARAANAYDFVTALPLGWATQVGEKGVQMSGGQKQRIAIARAILRNPRVLLLDEATSALDSESEKLVQEALDGLMAGRTTVVVAHRLSTIINADTIAVVKRGQIVESGSHDELIRNADGAFSTLIASQQSGGGGKVGEEEDGLEVVGGAAAAGGPLDAVALMARRASLDKPAAQASTPDELEKGDGGSNAKKAVARSVGMGRLARMNAPDWPYFVIGVLSSAAMGFTMPGFALALASIIGIFFMQPNTASCPFPMGSQGFEQCIIADGRKWSLIFMGIGFAAWGLGTLQGYCFGVMGQRLARRLRVMLLKAVLRQEIGWFDRKENSSGAIIGRLSADTVVVRGAVGDQAALLVQNLTTVCAAYFIAFSASWSMTLVVTATLPVLAIAAHIQNKFFQGLSSSADTLYSEANQTASEALGAIRTIAAFSLQDDISGLYTRGMAGPDRTIRKQSNTAGLGFGFSQCTFFFVYALAFWFGGQQVSKGHMSFEDMLRAFFSILLAAFGMAQAQMAFPDLGKAGNAAKRVFEIVDRQPAIDSNEPGSAKPDKIAGRLELRNVSFVYPSRPNSVVFRDFSLIVEPGTTLALVGQSGSGKSTVVSLIERFYDPLSGTVLLDGADIRTLNLRWLRGNVGLVNQEPVLFTASVLDNIKYGNERASEEEVVAAARVANALSFIEKLPEGFETKVGEGGIQLSGGQKQRVAIARAVLKDPRILLLDEATSALDAESERIVQEALDQITVGRTTVVVAHRLSTIRNADTIAVVQAGKIVEMGSHDGLIAQGGTYSKLVRHQSSKTIRRAGRSVTNLPSLKEV